MHLHSPWPSSTFLHVRPWPLLLPLLRHDCPFLFHPPILTASQISPILSDAEICHVFREASPNFLTVIKLWPPTTIESSFLYFSIMHQLCISEYLHVTFHPFVAKTLFSHFGFVLWMLLKRSNQIRGKLPVEGAPAQFDFLELLELCSK